MKTCIIILALIALCYAQKITKVTNANWDDIKDQKVFLKFFTPNCGHCKNMAPRYRDFARSYEGDFIIAKVDCSKNRDLCDSFEVNAFPTLLVLDNGNVLEDYIGERDPASLTALIHSYE